MTVRRQTTYAPQSPDKPHKGTDWVEAAPVIEALKQIALKVENPISATDAVLDIREIVRPLLTQLTEGSKE